jgi:tripartite-type tricarboxylate transporter receptor subunit TctC
MPEVATFIELGWPTIDARSYWGALAPSATPREVVTKMSAALDRVLTMPISSNGSRTSAIRYRRSAGTIHGKHPQQMDKWGKVVKAAGIRAD